MSEQIYGCVTCKKTFERHCNYLQHINKEFPCDLICKKCCVKFKNDKAFSRHIKQKKCITKKYNDADELKTVINIGDINIGVNGNNNNVSNNVSNNVLSINIMLLDKEQLKKGIVAHGMENQIDLFNLHNATFVMLINKFLDDHIKDDFYSDTDLTDLFIKIVTHIYSNEKYPNYINICDDDPTAKKNKIFSGLKFVEDFLPKNIRNRRIVYRVLMLLQEVGNADKTKSLSLDVLLV